MEDLTFPTVLCPFYLEDAKLFINIYERLYLNKDPTEATLLDWREKISKDEKTYIDGIVARLNNAMNIFTKDGFAFVKLSSRSAKDAPLIQKNFKTIYHEKLSSVPEEEKEAENTKITCLLQAAFDALKVKTGSDVIDMFIRSERVYQDLLLAAVNQVDKYNENFVIRKFVDIDVDMEFRCFVFNGLLHAISQYNYLIYSKRLVEKKEEISLAIQNFFKDSVKPKLSIPGFPQDFVIDFAICKEDGDIMKIWVIEINPFISTTDGAMFSWEIEYEMLTGKQGFHFRIVEKPKPGAMAMLPQSVRAMLKSTETLRK